MADFQASTGQPGGSGSAEVQAGVGWLRVPHSLKARVWGAGQGLRVTGKKKAGSWPAPQGPPASMPPHLPKLHLSNKSTTHCQVPEHSVPSSYPISALCAHVVFSFLKIWLLENSDLLFGSQLRDIAPRNSSCQMLSEGLWAPHLPLTALCHGGLSLAVLI